MLIKLLIEWYTNEFDRLSELNDFLAQELSYLLIRYTVQDLRVYLAVFIVFLVDYLLPYSFVLNLVHTVKQFVNVITYWIVLDLHWFTLRIHFPYLFRQVFALILLSIHFQRSELHIVLPFLYFCIIATATVSPLYLYRNLFVIIDTCLEDSILHSRNMQL